MRFYNLKSPEYNSDYQTSYINGTLEHPYGFPGVSCENCNSTSGGCRILPISVPKELLNDKRYKNRWPVSGKEHAALQMEFAAHMHTECVPFVTYKPGDSFQPSFLDVPSKPKKDFLWSNLGSLVVSKRIKELIFDELYDDVDIIQVHLRKIGKRNAKLPPDKPYTGEPEDMINEAALIQYPDSPGPYFEIVVRSESNYPEGGTPDTICSVCKRESSEIDKRVFRMLESMWQGQQIFFLKTTRYIVVTEPLVEKIKRTGATNVDFVPY